MTRSAGCRRSPRDSFPIQASEAPRADATSATDTQEESKYGLDPKGGMLLGLIGILIAFGHSVLAMSGEESLAQVNREIEYPKHKNLMRAGTVIFVYSLLFTSLVSFFAYAMIPDTVRPQYFDNLISGIAMNASARAPEAPLPGLRGGGGIPDPGRSGQYRHRRVQRCLQRVSEDGVLTDWFEPPTSGSGRPIA